MHITDKKIHMIELKNINKTFNEDSALMDVSLVVN